MVIICPTVLASDEVDFARQMQRVSFADRIQVDLMDGSFASPASVGLDDIWWPAGIVVDIHFMYADPFAHLEQLIKLQPHMVIVHAEASLHHMHFAAELHKEGIEAGLAIVAETPIGNVEQILSSFDHLLIFSGNLGHFGGQADLGLLAKATEAKAHHPDIEIGWDGGVNHLNALQLARGGVDVLNAGGFIQKAESPLHAYETLVQTVN